MSEPDEVLPREAAEAAKRILQRQRRDEFFRDLQWFFEYPWTRDDFRRKWNLPRAEEEEE
jgi:hypothetical protein